MVLDFEKLVTAWSNFQNQVGGITLPQSEEEYEHLYDVLQELTSKYNCNSEPYGSLFDLIAHYMHLWELDNQPELKLMHLEPHERLKFLMERRSITQYQLAKEGIMS